VARLRPDEISTSTLQKRLGRYATESVDELIGEVRRSYEELWHEHAEARQRATDLSDELDRYRNREHRLSDVLLRAEQAAAERREEADQEIEVLLQRAREEAEKVVSGATAERDRMRAEIDALEQRAEDLETRYRGFLLAALELVEGEAEEREPSREEPLLAKPDEAPSDF
jgi:cell division septum initiation protein DivIVA